MKKYIILFSIGVVATLGYYQMSGSVPAGDAGIRNLQQMLDLEKKSLSRPVLKTRNYVIGAEALQRKTQELVALLRSKKIAYAEEVFASLKPLVSESKQLRATGLGPFQRKFESVIEKHQGEVAALNVSKELKNEVAQRLGQIKHALELQQSVMTTHPKISKNEKLLIQRFESALGQAEATRSPSPLSVTSTWAILFVIAAALGIKEKFRRSSEDSSAVATRALLAELDFPVFIVDSDLQIVWKNIKTAELGLETRTLQEMLTICGGATGQMKLRGKEYSVSFSEQFRVGTSKQQLVQCRPRSELSKHTDHLLNADEITAIFEKRTVRKDSTFGDVNQTVAEQAVRLNGLFKVSGKYLDVDFKPNLSDCFIEKDRLEKIVKEFLLSCHQMIIDVPEADGIYLRTDEAGSKYSVSCFLPNYKVDSLNTQPLAREFLRRFSVLEATHSFCNPSIDFKIVDHGQLQGLDVSVNFENQSELESMMAIASANA